MKFGPCAGWCSALLGVGVAAWPCGAADGRLPVSRFVRVAQSSDAGPNNRAGKALDGTNGTFSLTANTPGSYWTAELGRPYGLDRIELVNRDAPNDNEMAGLNLDLFDIDDQVVFQIGLTNPGPGATQTVILPTGLRARALWIGLTGSQTNGGGNYRVGLAEVRLFGDLRMPFGPDPVAPPTNTVRAYQSSDYSAAYPAANALDGDPNSFSHTANNPNSYWLVDLGTTNRIDRVELVNRADCCDKRLSGLVLRILDANSNTVASATVPDPGLGGVWPFIAPSGTAGRYVRVGLENGQKNADANYYVTLAEVRVFSGSTNLVQLASSQAPVTNNLASHQPSYMVRFTPSLAPAGNANDDNAATEAKTTTQTVDGYW